MIECNNFLRIVKAENNKKYQSSSAKETIAQNCILYINCYKKVYKLQEIAEMARHDLKCLKIARNRKKKKKIAKKLLEIAGRRWTWLKWL